jgi:hypothetical protein
MPDVGIAETKKVQEREPAPEPKAAPQKLYVHDPLRPENPFCDMSAMEPSIRIWMRDYARSHPYPV